MGVGNFCCLINGKILTFSEKLLRETTSNGKQQVGTGPSRRLIQGSKIAKGLPSVNLQYWKTKKAKNMNQVARRGPLAQAPDALKGGHFQNCHNFCRS